MLIMQMRQHLAEVAHVYGRAAEWAGDGQVPK
jgi:hypothetical protein